MKATIRDVAKYAGVSVATVSRYLNHSPLIAPQSIEKVQAAIEALNYQPSMMARGLLHGNSCTIALAVDDSNVETYGNDYFLRIQYGLEHALAREGYYLMICHIGSKNVSTLESIINENRIDGLVLLSELASPQILTVLRESKIPFVIAGRCVEPHSMWVDIDNIGAGWSATECLLKTGALKIGFLTNSYQKVFVSERYEGYRNCLKQANVSVPENAVIDGLTTSNEILSYITSHEGQLCDAYVATDSTIAFYFLRELQKRGILVPKDIQVIAFDDGILAEVSEPSMTVVKIDVMNLGMAAAKMLIQQLRLEAQSPDHLLLSTSIIERGSTRK